MGRVWNGQALWTWECNGQQQQQWAFCDGTFMIRTAATEDESYLCVDSGDMGLGSQLFLWECNGQPQQALGYDFDMQTLYFSWSGGENDASLCVDLAGGDLGNGGQVWAWECNGHVNQQWQVGDMSYLCDESSKNEIH